MALTREQSIELGFVIEERRHALGSDQADPAIDADELEAVDAALGRIAEGSYGACVACGGEIDYARLRANPAAIRCVECQRLFEKTPRHAAQT